MLRPVNAWPWFSAQGSEDRALAHAVNSRATTIAVASDGLLKTRRTRNLWTTMHGRDGASAGCTGAAPASVVWLLSIRKAECHDKRRRAARLRPSRERFAAKPASRASRALAAATATVAAILTTSGATRSAAFAAELPSCGVSQRFPNIRVPPSEDLDGIRRAGCLRHQHLHPCTAFLRRTTRCFVTG